MVILLLYFGIMQSGPEGTLLLSVLSVPHYAVNPRRPFHPKFDDFFYIMRSAFGTPVLYQRQYRQRKDAVEFRLENFIAVSAF